MLMLGTLSVRVRLDEVVLVLESEAENEGDRVRDLVSEGETLGVGAGVTVALSVVDMESLREIVIVTEADGECVAVFLVLDWDPREFDPLALSVGL